MSGDVKIGDRVHARTPNTAVPWIGTVAAIERSAFGTVYVVDVGHNNTLRATEATAAAVANEPTWRQTAENLREAHALVTEERDRNAVERDAAIEIAKVERSARWRAEDERDGARRDRDFWCLQSSKHLERAQGLERERDAALKDCEEKVLAIRDYQKREALVDQCFDLLVEARLIDRLPATPDLKVQLLRDAIRKLCTEGLAACDDALRFLRRTAFGGGSIVSSATMTPPQIAAARAADRMLVTPDGYGFVYLSSNTYEMTCDLARVAAERDAAREERDTLRKTGENLREALNFWCGRAETLAVSRDEATRTLERVTAERDEARNEALAKSGGFWGRAAAIAVKERDEARAERDALDRRCAETIRALDLVTVERDALRRRAAQLAELLRAEGDDEWQGEP